MTASLYSRVMGHDDFARLDAPVRRFHSLAGKHQLQGEVEIEAPQGRLARLLARLTGTPLDTTRGPIRLHLDADSDSETWTRHFPGRTMASRLAYGGAHVEEHLGPARLVFDLAQEQGRLSMKLVRMRFFGVPCPSWMAPRIVAEESGEAGRMNFHIRADVPMLGRVVAYRGWLELPQEAAD